MRLISLLFLTALLCYNLSGQSEDKPLVVASASIFADMAEVIAGDLVDVKMIVPIGGDPHIYDPTPADAQLVAAADLILVNGLTFEGWVNELVANSGTKGKKVIITQGVQPIASEEYTNSTDPHAWMDASNGVKYAANIRDALIQIDPENADVYRFNAGLYQQQIQDLDTYIISRMAEVPEANRILVTSHDAFRYYGQRYGIRVEAALGTSTDAEVRTADVARLTNIIRESGVKAIFVESTINPKLIQQIAKDNGVIVGGSLFADSLGDSLSAAPTYLQMLKHNTDLVVEGLLGNSEDISLGDEPSMLEQSILLGFILAFMLGAFFYVVYALNRGGGL